MDAPVSMSASLHRPRRAAGPLAAAALALWAGAASAGGWTRHEDAVHGMAFRYPSGLRASSDGSALVTLSSGTCAVATLEVVEYGKSEIRLPKRQAELRYDAKRNRWRDGRDSVCLKTVKLGAKVFGYGHTDAMHGWSSLVVLTDKGRAFVWSNIRDPKIDYCYEDVSRFVDSVELTAGQSAVAAACR